MNQTANLNTAYGQQCDNILDNSVLILERQSMHVIQAKDLFSSVGRLPMMAIVGRNRKGFYFFVDKYCWT
jgi:hypothetical protein